MSISSHRFCKHPDRDFLLARHNGGADVLIGGTPERIEQLYEADAGHLGVYPTNKGSQESPLCEWVEN